MVDKSHLKKLRSINSIALLRRLCCGAFLLLLASLGLLVARDARTTVTSGQIPQILRQTQLAPLSQSLSDDVAARHLFGAAPATSLTIARTYSSIEVIGMLSGEDSEESLAILVIDGKQQAFKVGDSLPDGEMLSAVNKNGVTLKRDGISREIKWDMQSAEINSRFSTLSLEANAVQDSNGNEEPKPYHPEVLPHLSGQASAKTLRQQLLSRPRSLQPSSRLKFSNSSGTLPPP
jgi:hypothetical protein